MGEPYNEAVKRKRGGIDHMMTQYTEAVVILKEQRNGSPQKHAPGDQEGNSQYGPEHVSRDMNAMKLEIDTLSRHSNVTTAGQEQQDPSPTCFAQTNTSVSITKMHLTISNVSVMRTDRTTGTKAPALFEKVLLASREHPGYSYDLDIAFLTRWHLVHRACPLSPMYRQNAEPDQHVLVIRKSFVAWKVRTGSGLHELFPDTIQVDGRPWHIRYCTGESRYCFAFPKSVPFRLAKRTYRVRNAASDPTPAADSTVLMIVEGPPQNPPTSDATDQELSATMGLEIPTEFQFPHVGCPLWNPNYGEVYGACKLRAATAPGTTTPVYDATACEEVVIKVVRHQNDAVPGAELGWSCENGQRFCGKLIHHEVPAGAALTSQHLSPYFQERCRQGQNENLVNEIETMAFVARAVDEAVDGDSLKATTSGSAAPDLGYLRSRFLPHQEVALSPDNLFIVTPYAPFGSLFSYISRERARNPKLSEPCVRHVLRHMLQGLCFLHERGLAHQDLSLENVVLQAPDSAAELRHRAREFLSDADFLRLNVVLIDMGHMGIHQREADISLQHSLLNASNTTVNTATTCESTTSDLAGPGISLDCSAVHSRAGSMDSTSGVETSATATATAAAEATTPMPGRKFRMRPMPKHPLGKPLYRPPELSVALNPPPYAPGREYCGMCLDMWQLGVMAIYMLTGRPPYDPQPDSPAGAGGSALRKEMTWFMDIEQGQLRNRPVTYRDANDQVTVQPLHTKISPPGMALLEKLLRFNPEDRISAKAALEDPWFLP